MKKINLTFIVIMTALTGCSTVPEENLSTYNIHKSVKQTATYPEQEVDRLLSQAFAIMDSPSVHPETDGIDQDLELAQKPADYELVIDFYKTPQPPAAYLVDGIQTFQTKTLKIIIRSPRSIEFNIPVHQPNLIKSSITSASSTIVDDKITYQTVHYIQLDPTKPGPCMISIKNNLFGKDFELSLNVADSGRSIDSMAGQLGFEAFLAGGPTEEEINREFKKPNYRSVEFKDGFRFVSYIFDDYYLLYHVLLKNGKVYDVQRIEFGRD